MLKKQYVKSRQVAKAAFELAENELPEGLTAESVCVPTGLGHDNCVVIAPVYSNGGS